MNSKELKKFLEAQKLQTYYLLNKNESFVFLEIKKGAGIIIYEVEEQKKRRFQKELEDKKLIKEIIEQKAKETITDEC